MEFKARDVIAILAFTSCVVLLYFGINGEVKGFMGFILGYYFGNGLDYMKFKKEYERETQKNNR